MFLVETLVPSRLVWKLLIFLVEIVDVGHSQIA